MVEPVAIGVPWHRRRAFRAIVRKSAPWCRILRPSRFRAISQDVTVITHLVHPTIAGRGVTLAESPPEEPPAAPENDRGERVEGALAAVLVVGAAVRIWGIGFGLPLSRAHPTSRSSRIRRCRSRAGRRIPDSSTTRRCSCTRPAGILVSQWRQVRDGHRVDSRVPVFLALMACAFLAGTLWMSVHAHRRAVLLLAFPIVYYVVARARLHRVRAHRQPRARRCFTRWTCACRTSTTSRTPSVFRLRGFREWGGRDPISTSTGAGEGYLVKSTLTADGPIAVTISVTRRSPNCGCLNRISHVPSGTSTFASGVSPTRLPSM